MRAERYNPMRVSDAVATERLARGLQAAPRLVIVSASLDLPWSDPVYAESMLPPLVVTVASSSSGARAQVPATCELLVAPGDRVDPTWLRQQLVDRGLQHIVCEGGRALLADFSRAGMVDEWALTVSGVMADVVFTATSARCEDEFVFTRFVRDESSLSRGLE